jgi:hypothetical protein
MTTSLKKKRRPRRRPTAREKFLRQTSGKPQFQEANKSGKVFVIAGVKPS